VNQQDNVARAIAYFQESEDSRLLRDVLTALRPRAAAGIKRAQGSRQGIPDPLEIAPAASAATKDEALATVESTKDLALLQAISRAIGRRLESLNQSPS
jgi:hypothetical protein